MSISRIVIVPARGGSKRIPKKNIKNFCGSPMISHVLKTASSSGLFDKIHVSTESDEIINVVSKLGFTPEFARPSSLAKDDTPLMPVLKHTLSEYQKRSIYYDEIWMLTPCSPLITKHDLWNAAETFSRSNGNKPLLAVSRYPAPVEWAFHRSSDGLLSPLNPGAFAIRSQDLEDAYYDAGSLSIFSQNFVNSVEEQGSDLEFTSFVLPMLRAIDIDTLEDWEQAEQLFSFLNNE